MPSAAAGALDPPRFRTHPPPGEGPRCEPEGRTERILSALEREGVRVIALNRLPRFSGPPAPDLLAALESRYPRATIVGQFLVRWR